MRALATLVLALPVTAALCAGNPATGPQEPPDQQGRSVSESDEQTAEAGLAAKLTSAARDPDARVREAMRRELLSLPLADLPVLRQAAARLNKPGISPVARLLLREIVVHAFIREAKVRFVGSLDDQERTHAPFLGVHLPFDQLGDSPAQTQGVFIVSTEPGFVAYEAFEEGDLLVGIRTQQGEMPLRNFPDLTRAFGSVEPGDHVEFLVARGGAVVRVALRLDERIQPNSAASGRWEQVKAQALNEAESYWQEQIAPLLPRQSGAVARGE